MSIAAIAAAVLLVITVLTAVLTAVGVLLARDFYERLQYLAPVATVGAACVAAAILITESVNEAGIKAVLIAAIVFLTNAIQAHATARAGRVQQYGNLKLREEERRNRIGVRRREAA